MESLFLRSYGFNLNKLKQTYKTIYILEDLAIPNYAEQTEIFSASVVDE